MDHSYHYSNTTTEEQNLTMSSSLRPMARTEVSGMATIKAQGRRRSRASIKPPIRVLPAHKSNFRDMVQKLTGISNIVTVQAHHTSNPNPSNPSNSMNHFHHHHPYLKNPHGDPMIYSHLPHPTTHAPHHELLKRLTNDSPPHLLQDKPITLDTSSAYLRVHRPSSSPLRAPRSDIRGPTSSNWTPMDVNDLTSSPPLNNIPIGDDDMHHHHHDVNLHQSLYPNYYTNSMNGANYLGSLLHHHHPDGNLVYTNGGSSSTILPQYGVDQADDASCNVTTSDPWGARGPDMVPSATTFSTQPSLTDSRVGGLIVSRSGVDHDHKMMLCQANTFMARAAELEKLLMGNDDKMDNDSAHSHGSSSSINASVMNTRGPLMTHSKLVYQCLLCSP